VIVHRNREHALGVVLSDHVRVEHRADLGRAGHAVAGLDEGVLVLLANDVHAQLDAFIADEHRRPGDELADLMLALAAEGAVEGILFLRCHQGFSLSPSAIARSGRDRLVTGFGRLVRLAPGRRRGLINLSTQGPPRSRFV
jgi:hypothetical protein